MEILVEILKDQGLNNMEVEAVRQSFFLLLMLPVVTTIAGMARYIVGLRSLSVYAPIVLTFAFYEMGFIEEENHSDVLTGLKFGLVLYFIVFASTALVYRWLKRIRMHYVPKTTVVLLGVSISMILSIFLGTLLFERKGLIYLDIFSLIIITTLAENIISGLSRKSFKQTFITGLHTLGTAIFAYLLISLNTTRDIALNYALILIAVLIILNFYIGKFVGLRILEYWRFKSLLLQEPEPKKNVKKTISDQKK